MLDPGVIPSSFALGIDYYADNSIFNVFINGVSQTGLVPGLPQNASNPYFYGGFQAGNQAHVVLNQQAGRPD